MQLVPTSKNLDHFGLVSGMCDHLNLSSKIDELLPNANGLHQVSTGTCVKALILNGLGFAERRLYLSPHFFSDKPVSHLLGEGLTAEMFNDDRLGRCLDDMYAFGVSELFSHLAAQSYEMLGLSEEVDSEFRHLVQWNLNKFVFAGISKFLKNNFSASGCVSTARSIP